MDWEGFFTSYRKPGFVPGFEIVNKLGSGVFGEVYKARKESIGKFYAIKFLKVSDEKVSEAIFKELDSLRYFAQLDHPNLVTIEDKGEVMGIPYIVMGYAGDETLKKRLGEGRLGSAEIVEIFGQIAAGVAALHEKSIIHFDLKPANVFLKGRHARVGDYGLSKLVSESHKTMSIGRGTPYYMAPEMLTRKGDHRSDVYSLGVILYEMVTGSVPFTGDSEWEVLRKHETERVRIPAEVVSPFREVIQRALQKRPEDRFQSANELIAALDGGSRPSPNAGPTAEVRAVPPPLPGSLAGASTKDAVRILRRNLGDVVERIRRNGGSAAVAAREAYRKHLEGKALMIRLGADGIKARRVVDGGPKAAGEGSFFADFEGAPAAAPAAAPAPPPAVPMPHDDEPRPIGFFRTVAWLIVAPFRLAFWVTRIVFRSLGVFFRNFLRYSLILALTFGIGLLIHAAIRGFDWDMVFM